MKEATTFNSKKFAKDVRSMRVKTFNGVEFKVSLRKVISDIGISVSTLSRIENEKVPDVLSFAKICKWLDKPMEKYFINNKNHGS